MVAVTTSVLNPSIARARPGDGQPRALARRVATAAFVALAWAGAAMAASPPAAPVTVIVVRHAESGAELTPIGRARARLLAETLRDQRITHVFASHTLRAKQTVEPLAAARKLAVVQLPVPGSLLQGQRVSDDTDRQAAIGPLAEALLRLPPGSVALVGANMDNIFGLLNRLGVPVAAAGKPCARGGLCVPCLTKACFPDEYDRVWYLVLQAGRPGPLSMIEARYAAGWTPVP